MDPQIGHLMPVLSSPLLTIHVSVIMMAYALLSITFLTGIWGLITAMKNNLKPKDSSLHSRAELAYPLPFTLLSSLIFILCLWYCVYVEGHRHGAFPPATERMVYIPLAVSGMFLMCKFFDHAPKWILRSFTFVGGISLEIYLIHIQFVLKYIKPYHLGYWPTFLLMLAISIPLAWLLSKLVSFLIKPLPKNI